MNSLAVFCLFAMVTLAIAAPNYGPDGRVDVDEILSNRRLLIAYIKCTLDQGKCSASGRELKDNLKELLETDCGRCSPEEREDAEKVLKHLINTEADYWKQTVEKYDPSRQFAPKYEDMFLGKP